MFFRYFEVAKVGHDVASARRASPVRLLKYPMKTIVVLYSVL